MGILNRLFGRGEAESRSWDALAKAINAGRSTAAGAVINDETALAIAAVHACVRVLGEETAALPLRLHKRLPDGGREIVRDHPVVELITLCPNPMMTAFEWRELVMYCLNLRGNSYNRVQRRNGRPVAIWPMHPDDIEVMIRNGELVYKHQPNSGPSGLYPASDVLHFKGMSANGLIGLTPISTARETMGHASAAQRFGAQLFANSARPSGVLKTPGTLDSEAWERVRDSWTAAHGGANQNGIAILEEGLEWTPIDITPDDAQFIETRKLTRTEIAGIYRVPPHKIGDLEAATFSNIEQQDLDFGKHTLVPICERIEQPLNLKLLLPEERAQGYYFEHNLNALMRGDMESRYTAFGMLWDRGIINADEIRALENMNPIEDGTGSTYYVPLNFAPTGTLLAPPTASPTNDTAPEPAPAVEPERSACGCGHEHRAAHGGTKEARGRSRQTIQNAIVPVLEDAMRRVVRREVQDVRAAIKRNQRSESGLRSWLDEYYADTEYTRNQVRPAFEALASALGPKMMQEIGEEWEDSPRIRQWVATYVENFAIWYSGGSRAQLQTIIDAGGDIYTLLDDRLEAWENDPESTRAQRVAGQQSTRFGGTLAAMVFGGAGYLLRWSNVGKSCPLCNELEGVIVEAGGPFMAEGQSIEGGEGQSTFTAGRNIKTPPLHAGCDCVITPEPRG